MKEDDVSSRNVNPRSNRNSVASASASASATPVDSLRRRARSPSPPQTAAASSVGASSPAVPVNAGSVDWTGHGLGLGSSGRSCRPWDRGDLLRRLATFKPSNWLGKPKTASSLACAQKGWVSVDLDKIQCEYCGSSLHYSTPQHQLNQPQADSMGEEFSKQLDDAHESSCPWIGNCCPESLVQFPPTPPSALIGGYKDRCDGLLQFYSLPIVSVSAIDQIRASRRPQIDRLLANDDPNFRMGNVLAAETSKQEALSNYSRAQKLISLCGWEPRWLPNIQDCEEHSAQSARNGCPSGPSRNQSRFQDPGPSRKQLSASSRKASGNYEVLGPEYKSESRSPLLDCSLCGVTIRIWDFLATSRPVQLAPINANLPETSKKMALTRGTSATSGINGWIGMEQQQNEDVDEAETSGKRRLGSNAGISFYQTAAGASSSAQLNMSVTRDNYQFSDRGKEVLLRQPSGSEVGDRAASYESRGPSTRKRNLEDGGSTADRPYLRIQHADSVEGTVVDRDGDEVNDDSAGPSKRSRGSEVNETYLPSYGRELSVGGPSHSVDAENEREVNRSDPFSEGNEQAMAFPGARDSARASSVIAMDTVCHSANDDSMESVENRPGDFDDVDYPPAVTAQSADPSELNFSNQAQQSACFLPAPVRSNVEPGISSINDGEEVMNTETVTAQGRDGPSIGVSGGSVGMGASHEAEIHGADLSVHRGDSVVGDMEPVAEVIENLGQSGEFAPDQGVTDDFVPEEMDREGSRLGDIQDRVSQSVARADSGSKIVDSLKAESVESGEKMSNVNALMNEDSVHPSLSCNAIVCSGFEASKEEVTQTWNESPLNAGGFALPGSSYTANDQGPPNGDSNDENVEFDPIKYHNCFCPWVNENVAAAGCSSNSSSSSSIAEALCGWQLTLDALDSFQSLENAQIQPMESESAASLCKDDHRTPSQKLLKRHSFISRHGKK